VEAEASFVGHVLYMVIYAVLDNLKYCAIHERNKKFLYPTCSVHFVLIAEVNIPQWMEKAGIKSSNGEITEKRFRYFLCFMNYLEIKECTFPLCFNCPPEVSTANTMIQPFAFDRSLCTLKRHAFTGELEYWSTGELESWRAGELSVGALECWSTGGWSTGVLSTGVLENWRVEMPESWSTEALEEPESCANWKLSL